MRKQRPRGTTTREAVINAALQIADEHGVEGLTIRAVARLVGAPPMSLYTHFANKNELLDQMYAAIALRMYADANHPRWQDEMLACSHRIHTLLREHPKWAPLLARPVPPLALPLRERVLALMVADGMTDAEAFHALSSVIIVAIGVALAELTLKGPDGDSMFESRFQRLKTWAEGPAVGDNPLTQAAVSKIDRFDVNDSFSLTVKALISGLELARR